MEKVSLWDLRFPSSSEDEEQTPHEAQLLLPRLPKPTSKPASDDKKNGEFEARCSVQYFSSLLTLQSAQVSLSFEPDSIPALQEVPRFICFYIIRPGRWFSFRTRLFLVVEGGQRWYAIRLRTRY